MTYVVLVSAGEPETGLWCDTCLLASRVRVPIFLTSEAGSSDGPPFDQCLRCGKRFPA